MNDELTHKMNDRLEEALALLAAGLSLDEVLVEAGDDAERLRPLLELALEVSELPPPAPLPPPEASLQRLLAYGESLTGQTAMIPPGPSPWWANLFWGSRRRLGAVAISAMLLICFVITFLVGGLSGGGLALATQDSLPGQTFYPLKRAGEALRLGLARDSEQREWLQETFNEERRTEIERLLERGRTAEVTYIAQIDSISATEIRGAGITTEINADTVIQGHLVVGAQVEVEGVVQPPFGVIAARITVITPAPVTATPTRTSTVSPTPTLPAPTPTATLGRSSTQDTLNLPPIPTATPTRPATATLRPSPTSTASASEPTPGPPVSGDNVGDNLDNENENQNESQNEGGDVNNGNDNSNDNSGSGDDSGGGSDNSGSDGGGDDNSDSGSGSGNSGSGGGGDKSDDGGGDDHGE